MCAVNGALWTLKVEEGFYIVLPIIFYAIFKSKKPFLILVSLYFLSLLYWFVMDFYLHQPLFAKQLPGYLAYFLTGIFLFLKFDFVLRNKGKFIIASIFGLFISNSLNFQIPVFYPAAYGTLVIIAAYNLPFLNNFGKYGDFTYGLYIYHFPVIQLFRQYDLFEKYNPMLMAFFVILITLFFAILSWFVVEKRFLDRFKKNYAKQTPALC
jgi:peptidoglycan/LPS O-acetylase OafA/YrhL